MNSFLEIGELGIKQDIPAELSNLSAENSSLKVKNDKLKKIIIAGGIIVGIYLFRKYVWPRLINTNSEDE